MSFSATIPVAQLDGANAALAAQGFGAKNFSVPLYVNTAHPSHAGLHCIANYPAFRAAVAAIANVQITDGAPLQITFAAHCAAQGQGWGTSAPLLQGSVTPGLYRATPADGGGLWMVIQSFNRTTFNLPLNTSTNPYPALLRPAREPGVVTAWVQPIDAFDAYKLVNPVTGLPDQVTHAGQTWRVSQADGSGNNVSVPGVSGWTVV